MILKIIIITTIVMIIAIIINCPGAGWRLLQLGSARRHPCHSLQPLLHRVLLHPSSSFFVLSLTATPLKVWKIQVKRIFLNVDCPGYTPNLAYKNLFHLGGGQIHFTLITAFHQFPNKRRISACLRLSGSSAWCFTLSPWFSLVHAFSQIIVQRIFPRHNKTCLFSGRVATRPLSLPRLPSSSLSSSWSPSFSLFSAQKKKIYSSHTHTCLAQHVLSAVSALAQDICLTKRATSTRMGNFGKKRCYNWRLVVLNSKILSRHNMLSISIFKSNAPSKNFINRNNSHCNQTGM